MQLLKPCPHDVGIKCPNVSKGLRACPRKEHCTLLGSEMYALKKAQHLLGNVLIHNNGEDIDEGHY